MKKARPPYLNLVVDHMTLLLEPRFYNVSYVLFRVLFGLPPEDIIYEKRRVWPGETKEKSMTYAARIGRLEKDRTSADSIMAVVQPTEPATQTSHVRDMLKNRGGSVHWQHIALRTPDLPSFHRHGRERGVNFITPILKDKEENLIQVFSGEWKLPGAKPSGMFFEFVQREPSAKLLKSLDREAFFRDKTFLGLYQEKEAEYRSGKVTPFIDDELFLELERLVGGKDLWKIEEKDLAEAEAVMKGYARAGKSRRPAPAI